MSEQPVRTALYRIFGDEDLLLYIGISKDFGRRWNEHAKKQPWWGEHRGMTVEWHGSRAEAKAAETAAIKAEKPRHNKQHAGIPLARTHQPRLCLPGWLTVAAAATKADCPRQTVYNAVKNSHLHAQRHEDGRLLVREDDVMGWMAARRKRRSAPFILSPRQEEYLLDIYLKRPENREYGHFITTTRALTRRGLVTCGPFFGHALTPEGEAAARELHRRQCEEIAA